MDEHYGTDPMLECDCFLHRRIRELEARLKNHETYCPGLLARGARAEAEVERLKGNLAVHHGAIPHRYGERCPACDEPFDKSADHSGCRAREEDLEAEVERLKQYLNEVGAGGGRESGEAIPPEGESGTVSPPTGRTASSAAYPAARKEASP